MFASKVENFVVFGIQSKCCRVSFVAVCYFFFQAEDGIRDYKVTGVQTCALPISRDIRPIVVFHHDEENRLEWLPGGRHGEAGGGAGHAARGVADDDGELVAIVGSGGGGGGVDGGGGCGRPPAVLFPLVGPWGRVRRRGPVR